VTNKLINTPPYQINGMGVPKKAHNSTPDKLKAELGLEGKQLLTFVGELSARKNQAFVILAMPKILEKHPKAHLLLVGEGADCEKLSDLIKEKDLESCVTLLGRRNDVADILAATDVYVSAAKSEGLPFNIVEALAEGNQIVASAVKGHTDILEDGAGILFESENLSEYVRAVCSVLAKEKSYDEELIRKAYERFSLPTVFPETYRVLKEASNL
jgi:glycosyltransferase EpsD